MCVYPPISIFRAPSWLYSPPLLSVFNSRRASTYPSLFFTFIDAFSNKPWTRQAILLWASQICHVAAMSGLRVSCTVDAQFVPLSSYSVLSPDKQRVAGRTRNLAPPAATSTLQVNSRTSSRNGRRRATTSTVPRARSGWSGSSDFMVRLPGPLGRVLGRS